MACHWMFVVLTVEEEMQYTKSKHSFIYKQNQLHVSYYVLQMINNRLKY
jgi:hypothetical protein